MWNRLKKKTNENGLKRNKWMNEWNEYNNSARPVTRNTVIVIFWTPAESDRPWLRTRLFCNTSTRDRLLDRALRRPLIISVFNYHFRFIDPLHADRRPALGTSYGPYVMQHRGSSGHFPSGNRLADTATRQYTLFYTASRINTLNGFSRNRFHRYINGKVSRTPNVMQS